MTRTAKLYGGALYELAAEEGREDAVLREMTTLQEAFDAQPDYLYLLATPSLSKAERCAIVQESFGGKIDGYLLNCMKLLCERSSIGQFDGCRREYKNRYNAAHGIVEVRAVTAVPMSGELTEKLRTRLGEMTGKQVELHCAVDPACLGGVRLETRGVQLDGTVRGRLEALRRQLEETTL